MRFLYGLILGILGTVVAIILYLALAGGEYLLVLSPTHHDMKARLSTLGNAERQRDELADKLEDLERRFAELAERFSDLRSVAPPPAAPDPGETDPAVPPPPDRPATP